MQQVFGQRDLCVVGGGAVAPEKGQGLDSVAPGWTPSAGRRVEGEGSAVSLAA